MTFTDQQGLGEQINGRLVWLVRFERVRLRRRAMSPDFVRRAPARWQFDTVSITAVVDAQDGRFLEAFTDCHSEWRGGLNDFESEAAKWESEGAPRELKRTVVQVLSELWGFGTQFKPSDIGQIILRPRVYRPSKPARRSDGTFESPEEMDTRWLCQYQGSIVYHGSHGSFATGRLAFVRDSSGQRIGSIVRPYLERRSN